jgi:ubiquinone/menaquinone biosynthesis C-methylase UbiE
MPGFRKLTRRAMYQAMARFVQRHDWTFMNYGYAPSAAGATAAETAASIDAETAASIDAETAPLALDDGDEQNRYCIQLYHHVAGAVDLTGRRVLEVGSGRGGGAAFIHRYLHPAEMVGLDFSEQAVDLCRRMYRMPGLRFVHGDAEDIPFDDATFDAVVNVESSHCYGSMPTFLNEVARVLRPGGHFLFADFRPAADLATLHRRLTDSGLRVASHEDITPNVVAALEADNARKLAQVRESAPRWLQGLLAEFVGAPGSRIHDRFSDGSTAYVSYTLHKASR